MRARPSAPAAWRALLLPAALLLSTHKVTFAVGVSAGATSTPVPAASATATRVLYIPQSPNPTSTTQIVTIAFTSTPNPVAGAPPTAIPTKTFTPQPAATLPPPPSTGAPTAAATSAAQPTLAPQATPTSAQNTQVPTATPLPATSTPTAPASGVVFNEVLSNPRSVKWDKNSDDATTEMQWLELYNSTDQAIDITNWRLTTSVQTYSDRIGPGTSITAHGYLVYFKKEVGFDFAGVTLSLLDSNNQVVDSVAMPSLPPDQSYARVPDAALNWVIDPSPTLGGANVLLNPTATPDVQATVSAIETLVAEPLPSPPAFDDGLPDATDLESGTRPTRTPRGQPFRALTISEVRGLPDDSAVVTTGTITMPTGRWDAARAYIQDDAGILVHSYGNQALQLGDSLTVRGRVHHFHGEVEIAAVKGGVQTSPGGSMPAARDISPAEVGLGTEALLVQVTGRASKPEREYVTVDDGTGSARVFLYSRLGLPPSSLTAGQTVTMTGVVNAADASATGSGPSLHRLVPRSTEDILAGGVAVGVEQGTSQSRSSSRPTGAGERGPTGREIGPGLAFAGATPTEFATPVLTGRQVSVLRGQPNGATLTLLNGASNAPPWVWPVIAASVALVAGIAAGLWWRQRRQTADSDADSA